MHKTMVRIFAALACAVTTFALPGAGHADTFNATYLAAGVQTPSGITSNVNTFESLTTLNGLTTTTFGGSTILGTYTGSFYVVNADQYGGAGGTGKYVTTGSSYTLSLSTGVNYFGLWFSALDAGNQLSFYNGSTLLYTFTPALYQQLVGACPNSSNAYCGNPTTAFKGNDSNEQFAYLNFYDTTGTFNKVVFTQLTSAGFESDNHAVALLNSNTSSVGTAIVTPEPMPLVLAFTGVIVVASALALRKRLPNENA